MGNNELEVSQGYYILSPYQVEIEVNDFTIILGEWDTNKKPPCKNDISIKKGE